MFSFSSSSVRGLLLARMSSNFSSVSTRRLCFVFLSLKSPVVLQVYSPNYELFVCWELFHHEIYVEIFADTLQQIRISHTYHTDIRVVGSIANTATNWEQMTRGADNYCVLLT
jgi:hypothetical protein